MLKLLRSCLLFAMPRSLFGAARTLDLGAQFDWYNFSENDLEADSRALYADWLAVAGDLSSARAKFDPSEIPVSTLISFRSETRPRESA